MNRRAIYLSLTHLLIIIGMVLIVPRFIISDEPDLKDFALIGLLIGLAFLRSNFLIINYILNDYNQKILINRNNLTVYKGRKKEVIELNEIKKCYFIKPSYVNGNMATVSYFNYCCFLLKNGNRIFVTSLSFPIEKTLRKNKINFSKIKMIMPYLDKKIGELLVEK